MRGSERKPRGCGCEGALGRVLLPGCGRPGGQRRRLRLHGLGTHQHTREGEVRCVRIRGGCQRLEALKAAGALGLCLEAFESVRGLGLCGLEPSKAAAQVRLVGSRSGGLLGRGRPEWGCLEEEGRGRGGGGGSRWGGVEGRGGRGERVGEDGGRRGAAGFFGGSGCERVRVVARVRGEPLGQGDARGAEARGSWAGGQLLLLRLRLAQGRSGSGGGEGPLHDAHEGN